MKKFTETETTTEFPDPAATLSQAIELMIGAKTVMAQIDGLGSGEKPNEIYKARADASEDLARSRRKIKISLQQFQAQIAMLHRFHPQIPITVPSPDAKESQLWVLQPMESSRCSTCNQHVSLLGLRDGGRPGFFICWACGVVSEVGVGKVPSE